MNKKKYSIGLAIFIIVFILGAYFLFMHARTSITQKTTNTTMTESGMYGSFVTGSIEVLTDTGFTLTLADGTTKDVTLTATTTIQNYMTASSTPTTITSDQLSVGEQVQVMGEPNADGSMTALVVRTGL